MGPEQPVAELKAFNRIARAWGVAPSGIYFISREDRPEQDVRFFSFATRRVTFHRDARERTRPGSFTGRAKFTLRPPRP
jgi:hypothetical protein